MQARCRCDIVVRHSTGRLYSHADGRKVISRTRGEDRSL